MKTRNMNRRITFFEIVRGKNDDGELEDSYCKVIFSCWAEIPKAKIKEFRDRTSMELAGEGIQKRKDQLVFLIRYHSKQLIDTTMKIAFEGNSYEITDVEIDYAYKEFNQISAVKTS
ncbi:phage head closure protein [Enterococcus rotai]|uniref:phage head closure protein n=1 Tax=Enterococcus rotai TaxID=118060 RepID=UPI0035C6C725